MEQHVDRFAAQMIQTPSRQPVRQIVQRHNQDCATGAERTGDDIRLTGNQRTCATIPPRPQLYDARRAARTAVAMAAWPRALGWNGQAREPGSTPSTSLIVSGWQKSWPIVGV